MRVLIVDDERNIRESLKKYLSLENIAAEGAGTAEDALDSLERDRFDAVVLDLKLPGMSGQEALERMRRRGVTTPVIMISAHGQIPDAVAALKTGAQDYLVKPFDPADLIVKLRALADDLAEGAPAQDGAAQGAPAARDGSPAAGPAAPDPLPGGLVGNSEAVRQLRARIARLAATDVTVLITGESGTGKEVAARELHARGPRSAAGEPFVAVNIGGIHEGLMESELFGHEKGSFTGAAARKQGLFEAAGRGSIFLDEVGEMPTALQVKLLRVLQERTLRRLGGTVDIPINARIISATNRDLEALIREGRFREDLYYRLNVFHISLPPLRDRAEDIPALTDHLLGRLCGRMKRPRPALADGVMERLLGYSFPGNIRELENILERALIYSDGAVIRPDDIDVTEPRARDPADGGGLSSMEAIERQAIMDALERCGGNRTRAAEMLGLSRKTILNKLRSYGL